MATVTMTLPDIRQSVFRPIVIDVVGQVKSWTKIAEDVPVFFVNKAGQLATAGSTLDDDKSRLMRAQTLRRVEISATEVYAEDQQITDISGKKGNVQVFTDRQLDMWIAPGYTSSKVTIDIEFKTQSEEEAERWRNDVTTRYIQGRYSLEHQITFSFNLPAPVWNLLHEVWSKREAIGGYGDTFEEYLNKCGTNRMILISNETNSARQLTVSEKQDRIQGYFSFTNDPEKAEYNREDGLHTVKFSYSFVYQRPNTVDMHYPIIVHQQLLRDKFIDFVNKRIEPDDRAVHRSQFLWGMKQFEHQELMKIIKPQHAYMRIPSVDDFPLDYAFPGTAIFLLVLLEQPEAQKFAFNLRELGDIVIDEDILDFIEKEEYQYIGVPGKSIFHFEVYRNRELMNYPAVEVKSNLDIMLTGEVDVRKEYRARLAVFTDLSFIDRAALERLMKYPKAFQKVFASINELLRYDTSFQQLGNQRHIFPWQLTRLYECVMGQGSCNIYTGPQSTYNMGGWGAGWINNQRTFLTDIPESVLKTYRSMRKAKTNIQILGIASYKNREALLKTIGRK